MKPKSLYLVLCVIGAILPYAVFLPFVWEHGLDFPLIFRQLFVNRISTAFAFDILISSIAFCSFVLIEGRRAGVRHLWAPIAANIVVGLSMGLPLFLYMREARLSTAP